MFRAFLFVIQLVIIVGGVLWLSEQPGLVVINWQDYTIRIAMGDFMVILVAFIFVFFVIYKIIDFLFAIPKKLSRFRHDTMQKRGYHALTQGFAALAIGDTRKAARYAKKTLDLIPEEEALPALLYAQTSALSGEEDKAYRVYKDLLASKEGAIFGARGLLGLTLGKGKHKEALEYAYQVKDFHPNQPWVLKTVYALELENHLWDKAVITGRKAVKKKGLEAYAYDLDLCTIHIMKGQKALKQGFRKEAEAEFKQALKIDPLFVPAAYISAQFYIEKNKKKAAAKIIETCWKENPHPDLLDLWRVLAPSAEKTTSTQRMAWFERLLALNTNSVEAQMAAAGAAMNEGMWGEARSYLRMAESIAPNPALYKLFAELEQKTGGGEAQIRQWLEKSFDASPQKVWVCQRTGIIYDHWSPIAQPHGSFNTITWDYPGQIKLVERNDPGFESLSFRNV